jgi:hypothetical protein
MGGRGAHGLGACGANLPSACGDNAAQAIGTRGFPSRAVASISSKIAETGSGDAAAMARPIIRDVVTYALSLVLAYGAGIVFVLLFVPLPGLVDIVSACKIVSLLILIYANREIPEMIEIDRHSDLSLVNFVIIVLSGLIMVLMVVKLVIDGPGVAGLPPGGRAVMDFFARNAYWISTLPVFSYVLLDVAIALRSRGAPRDRANAMEFVVFRDLVCAAPLALVLLLAEIYGGVAANEPVARATAEVFFSGALAVILLSSAIATKALNRVQHERLRRGPRAHGLLEGVAVVGPSPEVEERRRSAA